MAEPPASTPPAIGGSALPGAAEARLRLAARDAADLQVISAMLQDALVPVKDLRWLAAEHCFVAVVNRFCWEHASEATGGSRAAGKTRAAGSDEAATAGTRVLAGLRIDGVSAVRSQGFDRGDRDRLLSLLAVQVYSDSDAAGAPSGIELIFAGHASIRLAASAIAVGLEDLGEAWPTLFRPDHGAAADMGAAPQPAPGANNQELPPGVRR